MNSKTLLYILKRIALAALTVWVVITITFFVSRAVPGGPFMGEKAISASAQAALEAKYGLDKPVFEQYTTYLADILTRFDFGPSLKQRGQNVIDIIGRGLNVSAKLGLSAAAIAAVFGIVMGSTAALKRNSLLDRSIMVFSTACVSMPSFIMGSFLLLIFALKLGWLPANGTTATGLILPIITLIVSCVLTMIYTGGFFDPESGVYMNFVDAFAGCDASMGLVLGSFFALAVTFLLYLPRKVITFKQFADSFVDGFRAMVSSILILIFAWTLSGVTNQLGAKVFVAELVRGAAGGLANFLPAIIFVIGCFLAFSTGTSWGTFGVLLPIVCAVFPNGELMVISVAACLAGAGCGDHCSPISDTTFLASAGADCDHIAHVNTQLPYAITVAAVTFVGYILAGFVQNAWIVLPAALALMAGTLLVIRNLQKKAA